MVNLYHLGEKKMDFIYFKALVTGFDFVNDPSTIIQSLWSYILKLTQSLYRNQSLSYLLFLFFFLGGGGGGDLMTPIFRSSFLPKCILFVSL